MCAASALFHIVFTAILVGGAAGAATVLAIYQRLAMFRPG